MTLIKQITTTTVTIGLLLASSLPSTAQSLVQQWKQGLSGSLLTNYTGRITSNHSSLTILNLCRNGRYSYIRDAGWSAPGSRVGGTSVAGGASKNRITGRWDIQQRGYQVFLVYRTDRGQQGSFPLYLQNNGRVNIGGAAYAVQQGGARC